MAIGEPILALIGAMLVTLALSVPVMPAASGADAAAEMAERLARESPGRLVVVLAIQSGVLLLCGGVMGRRVRPSPPRKPFGASVALGIGGGVVALLLSAAIGTALGAVGIEVEEQAWLVSLFGTPGVLLMLGPWMVIVGPVAEEVFFRGYAFRRFRAGAGWRVALVLSSFLFAIIHFNPSGFLVYFAIGAVLGWLTQHTGRLIAPIAGHVTVNAVVLIGSVLVGRGAG